MSEFDRIYSEKWEELIKGNVSPTEARVRAHVYAEEITGIFVNLPLEAFVEDDGECYGE